MELQEEEVAYSLSQLAQEHREVFVHICGFMGDNPGQILHNIANLSVANKHLKLSEEETVKLILIGFGKNIIMAIPNQLSDSILHIMARKKQYGLLATLFDQANGMNIYIDYGVVNSERQSILMVLSHNKPKYLNDIDQAHFNNCFSQLLEANLPPWYHSNSEFMWDERLLGNLSKEQCQAIHKKFCIRHYPMFIPLGAIHYIVVKDRIEELRQFLERHPNVNLKSKAGLYLDSPLHIAAFCGCNEILTFLLQQPSVIEDEIELNTCGPDVIIPGVDIKNFYSETPLMLAAMRGNIECLSILLAHQASVDGTDISNWTALMHAANHGQLNSIKLLLENGASIDSQNKDGQTALTLAQKNNHDDCAQYLLEKGAAIH